MKIIDLLNKIANGEELPKKIKYKNKLYYLQHYCNGEMDYTNEDYLDEIYHLFNEAKVNDEVEILEEKKIPENLPFKNDMKLTIMEVYHELEKYNYKINEIIDYLKSKGE